MFVFSRFNPLISTFFSFNQQYGGGSYNDQGGYGRQGGGGNYDDSRGGGGGGGYGNY